MLLSIKEIQLLMRKHINKLALSSKRYYSFIENIVKETRAYFENADEGYTILWANYLNEDRFDEDEKFILSVFNSDDISNQTLIYGAVCAQPYQETESQLVSGLLITDERIYVCMFVTDDQEHDFEHHCYCEWDKLASAKIEKDEDGDDFIFPFHLFSSYVSFCRNRIVFLPQNWQKLYIIRYECRKKRG